MTKAMRKPVEYSFTKVQDTYQSCDGYSRLYGRLQLGGAYIHGCYKPHYPLPVVLQDAWYSRIWQTKLAPYTKSMFLAFVKGHFELMGWL